ncbi:MAG: DUF3387 domain-containing protein [Verrucomicrobia bacterium]|nr:DUF3387 domain-containing protein [Verrucomicrobiota bacterium]
MNRGRFYRAPRIRLRVVDCLGLADQLRHALAAYTESGGKGNPTFDTRHAIAVMLEKHGITRDLLRGFGSARWITGTAAQRLALIPAGQEHILAQEEAVKTVLMEAELLCADWATT